MKDLLEALKQADSLINMQDVVQLLNDEDIDYYGWNDLQMIIWYIEKL